MNKRSTVIGGVEKREEEEEDEARLELDNLELPNVQTGATFGKNVRREMENVIKNKDVGFFFFNFHFTGSLLSVLFSTENRKNTGCTKLPRSLSPKILPV
jgi:hypothetical protein